MKGSFADSFDETGQKRAKSKRKGYMKTTGYRTAEGRDTFKTKMSSTGKISNFEAQKDFKFGRDKFNSTAEISGISSHTNTTLNTGSTVRTILSNTSKQPTFLQDLSEKSSLEISTIDENTKKARIKKELSLKEHNQSKTNAHWSSPVNINRNIVKRNRMIKHVRQPTAPSVPSREDSSFQRNNCKVQVLSDRNNINQSIARQIYLQKQDKLRLVQFFFLCFF
jgi:hypothetical protein